MCIVYACENNGSMEQWMEIGRVKSKSVVDDDGGEVGTREIVKLIMVAGGVSGWRGGLYIFFT